jgi:hypothetical protein
LKLCKQLTEQQLTGGYWHVDSAIVLTLGGYDNDVKPIVS